MAHTDACKIQVTEFVKKLTAKGLSVNEACKEAERESDGIPAETIRSWWKQIQTETKKIIGENPPTPTTSCNSSENPEKRIYQKLADEKGKYLEGTCPGPGRRPKYAAAPRTYTNAVYLADIAISQLSRIEAEDPKREEAFQKVINWINEQLKGR